MKDSVNSPQHYGGADNLYEVIKVIEAWGLGFNLGNAVKYIARAGKKSPDTKAEDLQKAVWYINRETGVYTIAEEFSLGINGIYYADLKKLVHYLVDAFKQKLNYEYKPTTETSNKLNSFVREILDYFGPLLYNEKLHNAEKRQGEIVLQFKEYLKNKERLQVLEDNMLHNTYEQQNEMGALTIAISTHKAKYNL